MTKKEYQKYRKNLAEIESTRFDKGTHSYPKLCYHCNADIPKKPGIRCYFLTTYKLNKLGYKTAGRHLYFHDNCWKDIAGEDYDMDW